MPDSTQTNDEAPGGLFGDLHYPKYVYQDSTLGAVTVEMKHFIPDSKDGMAWSDNKEIVESQLSSERSIIYKGSDYLVFSGIDYIFKYAMHPEGNRALAETKVNTYLSHLHKPVTLYRFSDGLPFKDANGNVAQFIVTKAALGHLESLIYHDIIYLEFTSLTGISYANMITETA